MPKNMNLSSCCLAPFSSYFAEDESGICSSCNKVAKKASKKKLTEFEKHLQKKLNSIMEDENNSELGYKNNIFRL